MAMRLVVVTHYPPALAGFERAAAHFDAVAPGWGSLTLVNSGAIPTADDLAALTAAISASDALLVDLMGSDQRWVDAADAATVHYEGQFVTTGAHFTGRTRLGSLRGAQRPGSDPHPDAVTHARLVSAYRRMRGRDAEHVLGTLLRDHGGLPALEVPEPASERRGVWPADPATATRYETLADYCDEHGTPDGRPAVALLYSGTTYPLDKEAVAARVVEAFGDRVWVLPLAVETDAASALDRITDLCTTPGFVPDVLVNLIGFRFGAGPMGGRAEDGEQALERIGAPLVSPLVVSRHTRSEWHDQLDGLEPSDVLVSLMLPEFDGAIDQVPIATRADAGAGGLEVIDEQLDHLVERVMGLVRLRRLDPAETRVALVGYDYPAGEGRLLAASQLDVAASIAAITGELAAHGYATTPVTAEQLRADLTATSVNSPAWGVGETTRRWSRSDARAALDNLRAWAQVDAAWPPESDAPMVDDDGSLLIPGVEYGNVFVGVQPGRASRPDPASAHDATRPPHPQYLAYYTWLRSVWRADVIVHVGTHGTLEFLKSKQNAVSVDDFPDLMLGGTPHVYLYYVGNPAEALVARRRSHAVVVGHQPPVMLRATLDDQTQELADLLAAWRRSTELTPGSSEELLAHLGERAAQAHRPNDPAALEGELERLQAQLVPEGLHVFGQAWTPTERAAMVTATVLAGTDNDPPAAEALARAARALPGDEGNLGDRQLAAHEQRARILVERALASTAPASELGATDAERAVVEQARRLDALFATNREWEFLHRALRGRHVPSRAGGDVVRQPDVLPAGASLHQFDPRQVPSPRAARRGVEMAEQLRRAHRNSHGGADPTCVGLVLWGLETTRTHGEAYAQVLSLLGVRPRRAMRPGQARWEIMPADELEAPRVDVVVTLSGFFRDLYGALVDDLDDITAALSALDEPPEVNPIAARTRATRAHLLEGGVDATTADELAHLRVFGPPPDMYGTGLTTIVDEGTWSEPGELADQFLDTAHHVYSRRRHGTPAPDLYRGHLADVELVTQSRSTNEHHVTDLDHFFEFLGGMSAAVAGVRGARVPTLVTDTTARRVHTQPLVDAVRAGLSAQLLNPSWTESMLRHGHQGVGEIEKRTTNLTGLAATTGQVEGWAFDAVFDRYLGDADMLARLRAANPHGTELMAERLGEAAERSLWAASPERRAALREILLDVEADLEGPEPEEDA